MGKKSPPSETSQTIRQEIDPDLKNLILGNVGTARLLTSGMIPQKKQPTYINQDGSPMTPEQRQAADIAGGRMQMSGSPLDGTFGMTPGAGGPNSALINPNAADYVNADGTPYTPPTSFTADFTPEQGVAMDRALTIGNDNSYNPQMFGADVAEKLKNFVTPEMQAAMVGNVGRYNASTIDPTGLNFTDLDFGKYASPYKSEVISPLTGYFDEMANRAVAQQQGKSLMGSGVRGSNDQLGESLTRGEIALQSGPTISNAYQSMFNTSAGLATGDLNRMADVRKTNATLETQASRDDYLGRLQAAMQDAQFKQQANLTNVDSAFKSPLIMQAGVEMGNNANLTARNISLDNLNMIDTVGTKKRGLIQDRLDDPYKALGLVTGQVTGATPSFTGQTSTGTSPYGRTSPIAGAIGAGAGAYGLASAAGLAGTAATGETTAVAASPWLWPIVGAGALVGAFS